MQFTLVYIGLNMIMIRFRLLLCLQEFEVNDNTYQIFISTPPLFRRFIQTTSLVFNSPEIDIIPSYLSVGY